VEAALLFNEKKYPPMLPRILRVVRAKAVRKTANAVAASRDDRRAPKGTPKNAIYNPKVTAEFSSLKGRASKLLGRAGAAQFNKKEGSGANDTVIGRRGDAPRAKFIDGIAKPPEAFVFEGFRASAKNGKPKDLKMGGKGSKKGGKPKNRSARRASDWKKGGAKK
jgi:nucleolar protein 12